MKRQFLAIGLMATSIWAWPHTALAQEASPPASEAEALRAQLQAMQEQMDALKQRITSLEQSPPQPAPSAPVSPPLAAATPDKAPPKVEWKGAPEISTEDGWSFKPRGRLQVDFASVDTPAGVPDDRGGFRTEFRRIFLGVDGKIPGGFAYRIEADVADGISLTDAYLSYGPGPLTVTVGHVKPFWGLEEMTSDLFTSMMERSTLSQAFGFERRVGLSAEYAKGDILLQGGLFGANAEDLLDDRNNSFSADVRGVWSPKLSEDTMLHLGASFHMRNLNDPAASVRYRARPGAHTTDMRLVDTGEIDAKGERAMGLEATIQSGPFHATAEGYWQKIRRIGGENPTFFGGYAEVGMVLTKGDKRGYKEGAYDRLKPSQPITKGGIGAFEVNARYDHLDLNDQNIIGGQQKAAWLSLVWVPINYVRVTANYGHLWISDARIAAADGDRRYGVDSFGLRTQIDF